MQNTKKGFTLIEILTVVGLGALLIILVLINVAQNRRQTRDRVRIADIQSIQLALEEYRSICGQYPQDIYGSSGNKSNGCPTGVSFDDFLADLPTDPKDESNYHYAGLQTLPGLTGNAAFCFDYHIGATLETESTAQFFQLDHDADNDTNRCTGSPTDFDGSDDDSDGIYDFRSTNIHNN